MDATLTEIDFEKYNELLMQMSKDVLGLIVFNNEKKLLWSPTKINSEIKTATHSALMQNVEAFTNDSKISIINNTHSIYTVALQDNYDINIGLITAVIMSDPLQTGKNQHQENDPRVLSTLQNLALCIVNELELNAELNSMALDLSERYEELNLIYSSDEDSSQCSEGQGGFDQIAINCIDFIDIDMALLILPSKNSTYVKYSSKFDNEETKKSINQLAISLTHLTQAKNQALVINNDEDCLALGFKCNLEFKFITAPIYNANNEMCGCLIVAKQIHEKNFSNSDRNLILVMSRRAGKIFQATYDKLTGLLTRSSFESILDEKIVTHKTDNINRSLLILNIEQLNIINDLYGLDAGDAVIQHFGKLLEKSVKDGDYVARLSGDEFGLLLDDCTAQQSRNVAARLQAIIMEESLLWKKKRIELAFRTGIVPVKNVALGRHLLNCGDAVISLAKHNGHSSIELYRQDDETILTRKKDIVWVNNIQEALREDRFRLVCQGIYDCNNIEINQHYEVLIRMLDDSGQLISPFHFLPAAERYHLMPEIDQWVIKKTIQLLTPYSIQIQQSGLSWAINLSGQSISSAKFHQFLINELKQTKLPTSCLSFEVTESSTIDNINQARILIHDIKEFGCSLYLDDFGTGLSSFSYMQMLPFDFIKIDGSFIKKIRTDSVSHAMVKAICDVVKAMKLQSVAEFVESEEDVKVLREIGVDFLQGYLLHKPEDMKQVLINTIASQIALPATYQLNHKAFPEACN